MTDDQSKRPVSLGPGYAAIATAVVVWGGWIVATREAAVRDIAPLDVALFRYGTPALALAPIWLRKGLLPPGESLWRLAIMAIGWGGAFVVLVSIGLKTVPTALFAPLVPALLPLIVALWTGLVWGERYGPLRLVGLGCIAAGVALVLGPAALTGDSGLLTGAPYLLVAACGWSAFTIAFRGSSLNGLEATAYISLYSFPFLILGALIFGTEAPSFGWGETLWQIGSQGIASGIVAVSTYGFAVQRLGLARAASFTSLVPAAAALGGWALLGERVSGAGWLAVGFACVGVALVNRPPRGAQKPLSSR